jgi:competence protein ComEC
MIWFYAFLTGLSPPISRAATMITFYVVGDNLVRKAGIYNSMASSALFLLMLNPNHLFDIGFQLSYLAIFGIVFLQPKFDKIYKPENKVGYYFWSVLTVSTSAQLSTLPFILYYFNQFPVYFLLTNLIIMPFSQAIIPLGVALLFVANVPVLGSMVSYLTVKTLSLAYNTLEWIEALPNSVLLINPDKTEFIFMLLILFLLFGFISIKRVMFLKSALFCIVLALSYTNFKVFHKNSTGTIIFFNYPENNLVFLRSGKSAYIISENSTNGNSYQQNVVSNIKKKSGVRKLQLFTADTIYSDDKVFVMNGLISFASINIAMGEVKQNFNNAFPDYALVKSREQFKLSEGNKPFVIVSGEIYQKGKILNNQHHILNSKGALTINFKTGKKGRVL